MDIRELCFNEMLENIIPRAVITKHKNSNISIELLANGSEVYLTDGKDKGYYISVPYELRINDGKQEIHGNSRNKIAKEFVEAYPTAKIYGLEQEYIAQENAAEKQFEIEKIEMQQIMEKEILPLFPAEYAKKLEIKYWGQREALIHFECRYENPLNHWKGYHNSIEIYFNNHDLNVFQMLSNGNQGICNRVKDLQLEYVKKECIRVINECLQAKETQEKQIAEAVAISNRKLAISKFAWNAQIDKSEIHILRRKNMFVALSGGYKYAVGTGKSGKYVRVKQYQIEDMITNKGYKDYCILPHGADCLFDSERLKSLEWKKIVA